MENKRRPPYHWYVTRCQHLVGKQRVKQETSLPCQRPGWKVAYLVHGASNRIKTGLKVARALCPKPPTDQLLGELWLGSLKRGKRREPQKGNG